MYNAILNRQLNYPRVTHYAETKAFVGTYITQFITRTNNFNDQNNGDANKTFNQSEQTDTYISIENAE